MRLIIIASLLTFSSCEGKEPGCVSDSECRENRYCVDGACSDETAISPSSVCDSFSVDLLRGELIQGEDSCEFYASAEGVGDRCGAVYYECHPESDIEPRACRCSIEGGVGGSTSGAAFPREEGSCSDISTAISNLKTYCDVTLGIENFSPSDFEP